MITLLFLALTSHLIIASQPSFIVLRVNAPDAIIVNAGWTTPPAEAKPDPLRRSAYGAGTRHPVGATESPDPQEPRPTLAERTAPGLLPDLKTTKKSKAQAEFLLEVKNVGGKEIKAVSWKINFVERVTGSVYKVVEFRRAAKVRPGLTLSFSQKTAYDEGWRRLEGEVERKAAKVVMVITGVEYADGTSWERP